MQPELERLKVKYKNQPDLLARKQREVQQRYMGRGMAGVFLIMLITLTLNLVVFFTLFSGLNSMAIYKASSSYDNLKYQYANCLNVADNYLGDYTDPIKLATFTDYENIEFVVSEDGTKIQMVLHENEESSLMLAETDFKSDFSTTETQIDPETNEEVDVAVSSNANIIVLIQKLKINASEDEQLVIHEEGEEKLYLSTAVQNISMKTLYKYYDIHKDSFLWIENIWQADSPFVKSIGDYNSSVRQLGNNVGEHEEDIYNTFMQDLRTEKNRTNGYLILPLLCVLSSMLTIYINTLYTKIKNKKQGIPDTNKGFKISQIILPMIFGVFALFYNSVFAVYMIVGQVVSALITPLQLLLIDKIIDRKKQKEEEKIVVDYSRKF